MSLSNQTERRYAITVKRTFTRIFIFLSLFTISFTNANTPPAPNVNTELRMNEGTGTTTADGSGNNHNGTLTNGPTWTTGKYGQAINFDGVNDYVAIADHADYTLDPAQSYTWSAWVKGTNLNEWGTVWSQTLNNNNFFYFYAHSTNDPDAGPVTNGVSVYWWNGSSRLVLHSNNNVLTAGQWAYVTVTYNGTLVQASRLTIYVNGTDVTNRTDVVSSGTIAAINPTNIEIGSNQPYGDYFNGAVDEVRYYQRLLSVSEIQTDMNTGNVTDTEAPAVSITAPATGTVSGTINVNATATDNVGVSGVQFLLDGVNLGAEDIVAPYSVSWNTTTAGNGSHVLTAVARDAAGNSATSTAVDVTVNNDIQAPAVSISAPAAGTVSGTLNVTADATDNVGVAGVQFLLDGANLGAEDVSSPYSVSWNSTTIADGNHILTARARDAAGNTTTSAGVSVNVLNNPPDTQFPTVSITAPAAGSVSGTIGVTASAADNVGVAGVQFLLDGVNLGAEDVSSPFSVSWNTATAGNGSHTLTAKARDAAGNVTTSAPVAVTVNNDIQAPVVSITAPAGGTVSGTLNVTADATDNVGVAGVQFLLDGVNLGAEDVSSPYAVSWNTTTAINGSHNVTARARDAAGNVTTSSIINVTVNNVAGTLITALPLDEGTGTAAADISGSSHPGTLTNGPTWTAGKYGQAVNLDGTNDYIAIADHADFTLDPSQKYTWSAWVKNNSFKEWSTVWSQTLNNANFFYFYAHTTTDPDGGPVTNGISAYWWNTNGTNKLGVHSNNNVLTLGQWSYVTVTYDGSLAQTSRFTIYVNGVDVTNRSDISSSGTLVSINPSNTRVGSNQPFGEYLNGAVDEVRYYKRLLTPAEIQTDMNTPMGVDNTAPSISITAPAAGNVSGTVNVTATATDNVGIAGVQFLLDGVNLGAEDISSPYSVSWNTTTATNGSHVLTAIARDAAGNTATATAVNMTVNNDTQAPVVSITSPPAGTVSGAINVTADATDNTAVAGVQFLLDGVNLGAEDLSSPYSVSWNTTTIANGNHTLTAKARDAAGNMTTSAAVAVVVNNDTQSPAVSITAPVAGIVLGTINVTADATDNVAVVGVQFLLDGTNLGAEALAAPYSVSWNTATIADGSHTLTAKARDAAGNITTSTGVVVTVQNNPPDTEPPSTDITSPGPGNVSGTISVTATATDNVAVVGVQFLLDGANLGAEDLNAPYSVNWNTTTATNGLHSLTVRARDAAGNSTVSEAVSVTVNNDIQAPTVSITAPSPGTVAGAINVSADATDNVAVAGVQFLLDGVNLGTEDITAPYSISWNTTAVADGSHTLTAKARDAAGNSTTSTAVIVSVLNNPPDTQFPVVSITAPAAGTVTGIINVAANATDNVGVVGVQFLLDGANLSAEDLSSPYTLSWNTATATNGSHTLTAKARDAAGNITTSASVVVTVSNVVTNLIAAFPFDEGTGTAAADVSGNNHGAALINGPTWTAGKYVQAVNLDGVNDYVNIPDHADFTLDPAQSYTWSAWVKGANLNEWGTVWSQTLNNNNFFYFYAHSTNDPDAGPVTNGVSVYWWNGSSRLVLHSNNNVLTAGQWAYVTVTYNGTLAQASRLTIYVNGTDVTNRTDVVSSGTIAAINPTNIEIGSNQPYGDYFNGAVDEVRYYQRLLSVSEIQTDMNTPLGVDNTAPSVSITAPAAGNVSGTVNITANASDNVGVAGVQFLIDGVNFGAEDVTAPYSVAWNTATASSGTHVLTARARDAAGNSTTSAAVNVNIVADFSFSLTTASQSSSTTGTADYTVNVAYQNGFTSNNVALSVTGLPAGVTGSYLVNPLTDQGQTQLHLVINNATPGTYNFTLSATAQSITHTQQGTLVINGAADFALSASPSAQTVTVGGGTSYTITLSETGDFVNPVTLSVPGLPATMTATFNPASPTPAASSVLTIVTSASTPSGTYNLTVQGVSGAVIHSTPVTLNVSSTPPPTWPITNLGSGWDMPIGVCFSKDGQKMFVWEKGGKVFVCNRNAATQLYDKQTTPVIDISPEVGNWGDHGLNGFALDPDFATNGLIYLLYVVDRNYLLNFGTPNYNPNITDAASAEQATIGRVTRYQTTSSGGNLVADLATRAILIGETKSTGISVLHDSHGMGSLVFASDGTLLVSAGDGATYNSTDVGSNGQTYYLQALNDGIITPIENVGAMRAQSLNSHNGKILRIDPATGNGIPSNPFYVAAAPRSPKSRIWTLGLRNPFRFNIRPGTGSTNPAAGDIGEIYVGDVGWRTYEELNIIKTGGTNCGWPIFEGVNYEVPGQPGEQSYAALAPANIDEPNPLFGTGGCTQQYFTFNNLIKQETADGATTVFNPCNTSVPITGTNPNRYVHRRPVVDWKHFVDSSRVPTFTGNNASFAQVGTVASGVNGSPFPGNCSIGGFWYTGNLFPANYRNTYFHADYGAQWIKCFTIGFTDVVQKVQDFYSGIPAIVCLAENPLDGTMVYVDIGTNSVVRIGYGGNQLPVAKITSDVTYGPSPLNVNFTGSNSFDPDGGALTYLWNFGDATTSTLTNPSHSFTSAAGVPKKFTVTLTVKDNQNATAVDSIIISANNTPPQVHITSPVNGSFYRPLGTDTIYALTADVTDAEHTPGQLKYEWQKILRHNNHEHQSPVDTARNSTVSISRIGCNGEEYYWLLRLKVTDAAGLSTLDSSKIYPDCSSLLVLRSFNVVQQSGENVVKWATESNQPVKHFEIEVSQDGYNFYTIHYQEARAKNDLNEYGFADNSFRKGVNYYRLKIVEHGAQTRYSGVIKIISASRGTGLAIYPNPAVGNFSIRYDAGETGLVTIRISEINGRIISTQNRNVAKGQNTINMENLPGWKPGLFLVTVQQGNNIQQGKLLFQGYKAN